MKLPTPYDGNEKYIFVSYSHKDTPRVGGIIRKLSESGYNVWFDSGIVPGSEWDENIANHIENCGCFIAFMSKNYLESNNCKDELNFARDLEKDRLVVYLEEVKLPSGLAMRINRLQSVFRYGYTVEDEFYAKLFSADCLETCKSEKEEEKTTKNKVETFDLPVDDIEENSVASREKKDSAEPPSQKVAADQPTITRTISDEEAMKYLTEGMNAFETGKKPKKQRKLDAKTVWLVNLLFWVLTLCLIPAGLSFIMLPALIGAIVFNATTIKVSEGKKEKISASICIIFDVMFIGLCCLLL